MGGSVVVQTYIKTVDGIALFCREPWCYRGWDDIGAVANGCGPSGWKGRLVPDSLLGCSIKEACNIHDVDYEDGRDIRDKESGDRAFRNNMQRLVRARTTTWLGKKILLPIRLRMTIIYYNKVRDYGGQYFWDKR